MPSLNRTFTNLNDPDIQNKGFPLDLLALIIPLGIIACLVISICIFEIRMKCKYQINYNGDYGSSLNSSIDYPSFTTLPKIFFIKEMQQIKISNPNEDICAICIDKFEENDLIVKLPCGHIFHKKCAQPWLRQQIESNETPFCPMCKSTLIVEFKEEVHETDIGVIIEKQFKKKIDY